jgi:hypothetical protein
MPDFGHLPGGALVEKGLADLARQERTPEALLLTVAEGRLRRLGVAVPEGERPAERELALYEALRLSRVDDPYGRYNAMLRELGSFLETLEGQRRRVST